MTDAILSLNIRQSFRMLNIIICSLYLSLLILHVFLNHSTFHYFVKLKSIHRKQARNIAVLHDWTNRLPLSTLAPERKNQSSFGHLDMVVCPIFSQQRKLLQKSHAAEKYHRSLRMVQQVVFLDANRHALFVVQLYSL